MIAVYLLTSVALIALDQLVKYLIVKNFSYGEEKTLIDGVFSLTYAKNDGAAWSIMQGQMWFFYIVTLVVMIVAIFFLVKNVKKSKLLSIALTLVIAGGFGNLIDRVKQGYVVDMLQTDFIDFPIFNIADSFLVIGVGIIFIYVLLEEKKEAKK
ncbi:signal peptidase II [Pilibacter termitis]|uniref:Lipoprotein signal peptidase n=1 Tax=Pilibacter termitis TaxID=263852 RepID=A0A1T4K7N2_9ENTE|nr:signal peptidase II [Pilibacter termitis]SJZ38416.1 signal peptidase II [Pilibacter termitis]